MKLEVALVLSPAILKFKFLPPHGDCSEVRKSRRNLSKVRDGKTAPIPSRTVNHIYLVLILFSFLPFAGIFF